MEIIALNEYNINWWQIVFLTAYETSMIHGNKERDHITVYIAWKTTDVNSDTTAKWYKDHIGRTLVAFQLSVEYIYYMYSVIISVNQSHFKTTPAPQILQLVGLLSYLYCYVKHGIISRMQRERDLQGLCLLGRGMSTLQGLCLPRDTLRRDYLEQVTDCLHQLRVLDSHCFMVGMVRFLERQQHIVDIIRSWWAYTWDHRRVILL